MSEQNKPSKEQLAYASLLSRGAKLALIVLILTFVVYLFGICSPCVSFDKLPDRWTMSAAEYAKEAGVSTGWGWVDRIGCGDYVNYVGITLMASVTILCYLRLLPMLVRKGDFVFAGIAAVEIIVLLLAASGLVRSGGH